MSDDFGAGLIPLEGGDGAPANLPDEMVMEREPAPAGAPPAEPPAAATPAPPAEPVAPSEPSGDDVTDEQIAALEQANDPRFAGVLKDLRRTRAERGTFKEQARAGGELARMLAARPDILYALQSGEPLAMPAPAQPAAAPVPSAPVVDPQEEADLRTVAETIGLYTPEGAPDLDKARTFLDIQQRRSAKEAGKAVQPIEQQLNQQANERAYTDAFAAARHLGIPDAQTKQVLDALWSENGGAGLRDPQVVSTALLVAVGAEAARGRFAAPPPAPPKPAAPAADDLPVLRQPSAVIPPERSTGLPAAPSGVTETVADAMLGRGFSVKDAQRTVDRLATHRPGAMFTLED